MTLNRFKSALKNFWKFFVVPPKKWALPKHEKILIYDVCGSEVMAPYFSAYGFEVIPLRGESVNIPCLLRALLKLDFWRGSSLRVYAESFIEIVSPRVVVTSIDNNLAFFSISNRFPEIKTIFIQNGIRDDVSDIFGYLAKSEHYHVDYMLVYGAGIGRQYQKYISGHAVTIGSFKSNHVRKSVEVLSGTVIYISQYHDYQNKDTPFCIDSNGNPIYWDQFFSVEFLVLKFLAAWCAENDKLLRICARGTKNDGLEKDFFDSCLSGYVWEYIPRVDSFSSYDLVDSAEIVVFIDSTLGYESIARGKKTASFSCRNYDQGKAFYKFGWPVALPQNGPFWTNFADEKEFRRVMDYLNIVSAEEWELTRQFYSSELMGFDVGNKRFVDLLEENMTEFKSC